MDWTEIFFGTVLVVVLLLLAGYYGWRQVQALRQLREIQDSPADEQRYLRRRAWRRLAGCGFMLILAVLLATMLLFLEERAHKLAELSAAVADNADDLESAAQKRQFKLLYGFWIIGLLLSLLAMLTMAFFDMLATRRFGIGQLRRIQADRRAMIERQVARLRQERNGHQ